MKLKTRALFSTFVISLVFTVLVAVLLMLHVTATTQSFAVSSQTVPAVYSMQHLLVTTYEDHLLVEEYLELDSYDRALEYDVVLATSQRVCEEISFTIDQQLFGSPLANEEIVNKYRTGQLTFSSLQSARTALLSEHKRELATQVYDIERKEELEEKYRTLVTIATEYFQESINDLGRISIEKQSEVVRQNNLITVLLLGVLLLFIFVSFGAGALLTSRITRPIDNLSQGVEKFSSGSYSFRFKQKYKLVEMEGLRQQVNAMFSVIEDVVSEGKEKKDAVEQQLLASQYASILEYIEHQQEFGVVLTIKDIKKEFSLTHPTAISRLKYLEEKGFVELRKEGRQKCIFLK
jgi:nitrogen fixation/metabolism regulation signal transduction histidine kinase